MLLTNACNFRSSKAPVVLIKSLKAVALQHCQNQKETHFDISGQKADWKIYLYCTDIIYTGQL